MSKKNKLQVFSNDPRLVGLPDVPETIICEFCGKDRYCEGMSLLGMIIWRRISMSCTCDKGIVQYEQQEAERKAKEIAEEKAKAEKELQEKILHIRKESGMGERFLQKTFQSFITETTEQKKIKNIAQSYARMFDKSLPKRGEPLPSRNGFIICGTKGTGKSHIASAIANDLINRGIGVICMTERNLYDSIRKTYSQDDGGNESYVRGRYERVPLLIIDDLGKEKPTEWTLATFYAIIDGRYDRAMPTIITTNYDIKSLIERLTPKGNDNITADAIVDRFNEMCEIIEMKGNSWRGRQE